MCTALLSRRWTSPVISLLQRVSVLFSHVSAGSANISWMWSHPVVRNSCTLRLHSCRKQPKLYLKHMVQCWPGRFISLFFPHLCVIHIGFLLKNRDEGKLNDRNQKFWEAGVSLMLNGSKRVVINVEKMLLVTLNIFGVYWTGASRIVWIWR